MLGTTTILLLSAASALAAVDLKHTAFRTLVGLGKREECRPVTTVRIQSMLPISLMQTGVSP